MSYLYTVLPRYPGIHDQGPCIYILRIKFDAKYYIACVISRDYPLRSRARRIEVGAYSLYLFKLKYIIFYYLVNTNI